MALQAGGKQDTCQQQQQQRRYVRLCLPVGGFLEEQEHSCLEQSMH